MNLDGGVRTTLLVRAACVVGRRRRDTLYLRVLLLLNISESAFRHRYPCGHVESVPVGAAGLRPILIASYLISRFLTPKSILVRVGYRSPRLHWLLLPICPCRTRQRAGRVRYPVYRLGKAQTKSSKDTISLKKRVPFHICSESEALNLHDSQNRAPGP
jgi:hypothetical protein